MYNQKMIDLYNQFMQLMQNGTEEEARKFLLDNFTSFPEEVQEGLTMAFFEEAITKEAKDIKNIVGIQESGVAAMSQLEKAKNALEEGIKIQEIKESIQ